jgi:hypothetical protein
MSVAEMMLAPRQRDRTVTVRVDEAYRVPTDEEDDVP